MLSIWYISTLADNMITTGALHISQLLKVTKTLQCLDISRNDIGDDGIKIISGALEHNKSLKSLTTLKVYKCGFSKNG